MQILLTMLLQHTIKIGIGILCVLAVKQVNAQPFQTSKYNREYNPYFEFPTFERGEKSDFLTKKLDELDLKPKENWTINDSIEFAEISLLTDNIDLSYHYLQSIEKKQAPPKKAMKLLVMDCYIDTNFEAGDRIINKHLNTNILEDRFFMAIYEAHKKEINNLKPDSLIFNFLPSNAKNLDKGTILYQNAIIKPIEKASAVLQFYVRFIHKDDPTIARAFNELGYILESYVSLNQAYVAYSIARIYNGKDKGILENAKRIKSKHVKNQFNTPQFRSYFPRIEYWRFDYEILKEKIIEEKNDTIPKQKPMILAPNVDKKTYPFPLDVLIPIGIGVILLLFAIFTRSSKKK